MINLENASITKVLPSILANSEVIQAIDYAIHNQVQAVIKASEKTLLYAAMEKLSSKMLDIMAIELRTHYYDVSLPIEVKRQLVVNTMYRYTKAGTPDIVEELLTIVFGNGELHEWFEYGGEPHHFKVSTQNSLATGEKAEDFLMLLESIKRKSSHLDEIEIIDQGECKFYIHVISQEFETVIKGGL